MINELTVYAESGRKAGEAINRNDWSLANFQRRWCERALKLETKADAVTARNTWSLAYSEARHI